MLKEIIEELKVKKYTKIIESNKFKDAFGNEQQFWYSIKGEITSESLLKKIISGGKKSPYDLFCPNNTKSKQDFLFDLKNYCILEPLIDLIDSNNEADFNNNEIQLAYESAVNVGFQEARKQFDFQCGMAGNVVLNVIFDNNTIPIWNEMLKVAKELA